MSTGSIGLNLRQHYDELIQLTACRCDPAWTDRNLHDPACESEYREDVEALGFALGLAADDTAPSAPPIPCEWCGRAIQLAGSTGWYAVKAAERGYPPFVCDASDDSKHHPPAAVSPKAAQHVTDGEAGG